MFGRSTGEEVIGSSSFFVDAHSAFLAAFFVFQLGLGSPASRPGCLRSPATKLQAPRIDPSRVFDRTGSLDEVPEGYRLMNEREVLKFQIAFERHSRHARRRLDARPASGPSR